MPLPDEPRSAPAAPAARRELEHDVDGGAPGASTLRFSPGTGAQLRRLVIAFAVVLAVAFLLTFLVRWYFAHRLESEARNTAAEAPPVDVVTVRRGVPAGR